LFLELSKDELFAVMKNLVYTFNWGWLKSERLAIERCGLEAFLGEEFTRVFRQFGSKQAKKLVKLSIISGTNLDSIIKGLQLSHWALFEKIELEKLSENTVRMRTIDCSLQQDSRRKRGTEYPCNYLGFSSESRRGFVQTINPRAKVKCIYSPPNSRPKNIPENVSCEWIISIP
jgi:hypothetical protein